MDLGLQDKVVVITGASRGLGQAMANGFTAEGCRLAICGRDADQLERAASEYRAAGAEVLAVPLDITEVDAAARFAGQLLDTFGCVDALVNNVGGNRRGEFADTTDEDWDAVLEVNLKCHIRMSRAVIPAMREQRSGSIVFVSSVFGREAGGKGLSIYNTTKSAVISLAKIMAMELAGDGIRVNSIAPGSIRYPGGSWDKRCIADPEGMAEFIGRNLPLGRFGRADEVANATVFLSSERAGLITGACIAVDGCQGHSLI